MNLYDMSVDVKAINGITDEKQCFSLLRRQKKAVDGLFLAPVERLGAD